MTRKAYKIFAVAIVLAMILGAVPAKVFALDSPPVAQVVATPVVLPPILITEVQTALAGSGNASKEFIELFNTTDQPIDLSAWQLWYISATAASLNQPTRRITFPATVAGPLVIQPQSHFVLSGNVDYLPLLRSALYDATLATNGHLRLLNQADDYLNSCQLDNIDNISWGTAVPQSGTAAPAPAAGSSIERLRTSGGEYIDTDDAHADFVTVLSTSPGALNNSVASTYSTLANVLTVSDPGCVPAPPPPPPPPPTPDPAPTPDPSPIPDPTPPDPTPAPTPDHSPIPDPTPNPVDPPPVVVDPPPVDPTPGADENTDPVPAIPAGNIGLKPVMLSELLPNPASPGTDDQDEFIELYNPNELPFDLSGYVLETGITTKHRYTFPDGTFLAPNAFVAYFSADTQLALSNTAGQARVIGPLGTTVVESDQYGTAKDGQSWLLANGTWQWSTVPTPSAANVVNQPVVKAAVVKTVVAKATQTAKTTAKKATAVKAATITTPKTKAPAKQTTPVVAATANTPAPRPPLHPGLLALVGVFALLYGAYEYRHDLANKFHQLRSNRAARREHRQTARGR